MPVYRPQSESMGSNSAQSGQAIDDDLSISIINVDVSTRQLQLIELSINSSLRDTSVISSSVTENVTTLVVTIRKK